MFGPRTRLLKGAGAPQRGARLQVFRGREHGCGRDDVAVVEFGPTGGDHSAEGSAPLQSHGEIAVEDTGQDAVGEDPHLLGRGRFADPAIT